MCLRILWEVCSVNINYARQSVLKKPWLQQRLQATFYYVVSFESPLNLSQDVVWYGLPLSCIGTDDFPNWFHTGSFKKFIHITDCASALPEYPGKRSRGITGGQQHIFLSAQSWFGESSRLFHSNSKQPVKKIFHILIK